ncbi:unnamed protein product [marine sediment metagenome]|uniref:Uncharacterized protein n=1 Tax=marine sediment metagenome TaxID=412755 RepID=X1B0G0_9ZZZZ
MPELTLSDFNDGEKEKQFIYFNCAPIGYLKKKKGTTNQFILVMHESWADVIKLKFEVHFNKDKKKKLDK